MTHSGFLVSFLALALPLASATPTLGDSVQPTGQNTAVEYFGFSLENSTFDEPIPLQSFRSECSTRCGRRGSSRAASHDEKIVGGKNANKDEFPWRCMVTFKENGVPQMCGCTVLSQNWILTAAHCTHRMTDVRVFAGFLDKRNTRNSPYQSGADTRVINHRSYNPDTNDNDISLIRVNRPITFSSSIQPACLPYGMRSSDLRRATVTASGWGDRYYDDKNPPNILQKLDNLPLISRQQCQRYYNGRAKITENMICTYEAGIDTCQGDSGGSIDYLDRDGRYKSIGVVSFGHGCAGKDNPGVYADVSKYLRWISDQTGSTFCGQSE